MTGTIKPIEEYRFFLYRHWNLFDSMYHSRFIARRLNIWTLRGSTSLNHLFAKIGLSLKDAKSPYWRIPKDTLNFLKSGLDQYATEFNINDYTFKSFIRV